MHLCRLCYRFVPVSIPAISVVTRIPLVSHVHELHPSHAFLIVPDKPVATPDGTECNANAPPDQHEELC